MIFWICFSVIFLPIIIMLPTKVIGKKKYKQLKKKKQNMIVCCNHTSNWDAPLLDIKFGRKFYYLGKKELFEHKFNAFMLRHLGAIPVDRSKADLGAIKKVFKILKEGKSVGIFPQGTRGAEGDIDPDTVKNGVAMFSIRTNTPVLPMAIARKCRKFKKNAIVVGDPIYPDTSRVKDESYTEEFSKQIISSVNALLHEGEEYLCKKK